MLKRFPSGVNAMNSHSALKTVLGLIVAVLLTIARGAAADTPAAPAEPARVEAPVVVFNRTVVVLRTPLLGVSPPDRARHSATRLAELFARPGPMKLSVRPTEVGNAIFVNGSLGLLVAPDDADVLDGETLEQATQAARTALERVAAETREARDRERLWHALAASCIATLLLVVLSFVVVRARAWGVRRLSQLLEASTHGLTAAGVQLFHRSRLFVVSRALVRVMSTFLLALAAYRWSSFVLTRFPYTRGWGEQLDGYLLGHFSVGSQRARDRATAFRRHRAASGRGGLARRRHREADSPHLGHGGVGLRGSDGLPVPARREQPSLQRRECS